MTAQNHTEGLRLQAERVVDTYRELRATAKSADVKSDEFPIGLFAELVTEIKQLGQWIEPPSDAAETDREHIGRELSNVREIIDAIEHMATHGEASNDAVMLGIIKRLARDAQSTLYGKTWDRLTDVLARQS